MILDSTVPSFQQFLLSQVRLKIDLFGEDFFGLAFDRFDHVTYWRHNVSPTIDDGLAWCGDACYPLLTGFVSLYGQMSDLVYGNTTASGRLMTANYVGALRVDTLQHSDGIFSEDYSGHLRLLYSAGLSTTGKPPNLLWTYDANEILNYIPNPDAYFAQHIVLKAFPFAPVLGNDHSIQPTPGVQVSRSVV